jgi:hypothetical protein
MYVLQAKNITGQKIRVVSSRCNSSLTLWTDTALPKREGIAVYTKDISRNQNQTSKHIQKSLNLFLFYLNNRK